MRIFAGMKKVYLDNAATTAMRPEVIQEIVSVMQLEFGNPSSTHSFGRSAKNVLELSRKKIAACLGASAQEIIFTSGATEANNLILRAAVQDLGVRRIITSRVEHHAVLHTVEALARELGVSVQYLPLIDGGKPDFETLENWLGSDEKTLVSLMLVNNETGTVLDAARVSALCKQHHALFHTDAVQAVGKMPIDLKTLEVDFLSASAHKFHGPKGVGFAFIKKGPVLHPMIHGGEQEKGLRAGTESLHNIAGMALALELAYERLEQDRDKVSGLKAYLFELLDVHFPGYKANGSDTFYNIANVLLPIADDKAGLILFNLDMKGIAISRGSACQSGSAKPSHVLAEILDAQDLGKPSLRISFSHDNSREDIEALVAALRAL